MDKVSSIMLWPKLIALVMLSFICTGCQFSKYVREDMGTTYEVLCDPQEILAMKDGSWVAPVEAHYLVRTGVFSRIKEIESKKRLLIGRPETLRAGLREALRRPYRSIVQPDGNKHEYLLNIHPQTLPGYHETPWEIHPASFSDPGITEAEIAKWRNQAVKIYSKNDTIEMEMDGKKWRVQLQAFSRKGSGMQRTVREPWVKSAQRKWLIPACLLDTALFPITVPLVIATLPFSKW